MEGMALDDIVLRLALPLLPVNLGGREWRNVHVVLSIWMATHFLVVSCRDWWTLRVKAGILGSRLSRGVAKLGNAPHLGCGDRRFKSGHPDNMLRLYAGFTRSYTMSLFSQK